MLGLSLVPVAEHMCSTASFVGVGIHNLLLLGQPHGYRFLQDEAPELPLLELLDHPWLNTRRAWPAASAPAHHTAGTQDMQSIPEDTENPSRKLAAAYRAQPTLPYVPPPRCC